MKEEPNNQREEEQVAGQATPQDQDPGFGTIGSTQNQRLVNKDGSYNVRRAGTQWWQLLHPYQFLIVIPWWKFLIVVFITYCLVNSGFACLYMLAGVEQLSGADQVAESFWLRFAHAFFFSVQTFTTVGYGTISPTGMLVNIIASFEAMVGLMGFALASGIMYGRFSRASARVSFSDELLIAPYKPTGGNALMFRIVNHRKNQLIELHARVVLLCYKKTDGKVKREFFQLELERDEIAVFPITWTIVHPIDESSPLWIRNIDYLRESDAEFLINLKGYDDTFDQMVHIRYSYKVDELVVGGKFESAYYHDEDGMIILEVDKVGSYKKVSLNPWKKKETAELKAEEKRGNKEAQN